VQRISRPVVDRPQRVRRDATVRMGPFSVVSRIAIRIVTEQAKFTLRFDDQRVPVRPVRGVTVQANTYPDADRVVMGGGVVVSSFIAVADVAKQVVLSDAQFGEIGGMGPMTAQAVLELGNTQRVMRDP